MKKYLVLLVALCSIFVFTACSNKNEVDSEFVLYNEDDLKAYNGTISIEFCVPSGTIYNELATLVPQFEALWNGKIDVDLTYVSSGYDGLRKQVIYDLNAGKAPTMVIGYPDHFAEYFSGDGVLDLDPYIQDEIKSDSSFLSDFVSAYLPENQISDDNDHLYGLPLNKSTEVMIYNKTVFDAMGYTVPTTWAEVETLSKQVLKDVEDKKLDDYAINKLSEGEILPSQYLKEGRFYPMAYDSTSNAFITIARQWGGEYTEKASVSKGYAVFNNANVIEGLTYFQNMNKAGCFAVAETFDQSYASTAFQNVQCIMTVGSSAGVSYNVSSGSDPYEIGVSAIPVKDASNQYVIQQGTNMCILTQSTNYQRAAAWQLIKYLTSTEVTVQFATDTGGYFPVRKSGYETDTYKAFLANTDYEANLKYYFSRSAAAGLSYTEKGYTLFVDPAFNGSSTIRDEVGTLFTKVIVNGTDITTAIKESLNTLGPSYQK